ncbi:MAG: SCP2 sterol-binding domain-containing protein [archaeon]|nr:SCP2 sterol-binding domain-containing protein [archaeon]
MTMEAQIKALVDKFNDKMAKDEELRSKVEHLKKSFNIDLESEAYSFQLENAKMFDFKSEALEEADVTISCTPENLQKLLDGELRPMRAYLTKKLVIKGKIQDLMFLKSLF